MAVFVGGLIAMLVFYLVVLVVGLFAARKTKNSMEDAILASRKFGFFVTSMTLTATWYGGGFISGTAEAVANPALGLVWAYFPWTYSLTLAIGGVLFAKTIRERKYMTFVDPLQERFGRFMGTILMLTSNVFEILYLSTVLLALGLTVSVVLDVSLAPSVIGSAAIVVVYTFFGGLKSVAWTDIVQLPCIAIGLIVVISFAVSHPVVSDITVNATRWTGEWPEKFTAVWLDNFIVMSLGATPVDAFLQRILAAKTTKIAILSCFIASLAVLTLCVPPIFIGAVAASTDWSLTGYAHNFVSTNATNTSGIQLNYAMTLPLVMQYLTPTWVAVISLGAVSAAVMSSMDSSFIALGSEFANNLYKPIIRPRAGDREVIWVMRSAIVLTAVMAVVIALTVDSVYVLLYLIGDFGGVLVFPQFLCAVHLVNTNTYGSFLSFVLVIILRFGGGDPNLGISPFIKYPFYSDIYGQLFPYKTFTMLCSIIILVSASYLSRYLFMRGILPAWMDFFRCFKVYAEKQEEEISMNENYNAKDPMLNSETEPN